MSAILPKKLYDVLGVNSTASADEIQKAYRKLAKQLHPDLNPGNKEAEDRFKNVASAFSILGDSEKRERYDKGEIDESGGEKPDQQFYRSYADSDTQHHYHTSHGYEDFVDLGDLFAEAYFRARQTDATSQQRPPYQQRGNDVRYQLSVNFLDAVNGDTKRITLPDGAVLNVTIPAGIKDGQTLRLKGKGQPGSSGGLNGDALVSVQVRPHQFFTRDGNDILLDLPIGIHEAILGGKVEVPTVTGRVSMTIPKGATSGQVLRLRGKGVQSSTAIGDQLVRITIAMPEKIDPELEQFFQTWSGEHDYNPRTTMEQMQ
ncbi:MAG: DnaJ C-terminal domain-containing protein [Hyphomicrobiaceae bacterium]